MLQVEAEKHPDISGAYEVGVVPYFVFFKVHLDNSTLNFLSLFFSHVYAIGYVSRVMVFCAM